MTPKKQTRPPKKQTRRRKANGDPPLVEEVATFIQRYVVLTAEQALIVALWAIHTHAIRAFEGTPFLAVTSPEKRCGKSRLLESLSLLVARPWMAVLPSEAVVYRKIDATLPTLLLDEVDTIFNSRTGEKYEGLRALLNAGNRRGATVPRCVGPTLKVAEFSVFCPKVLAGIGTLPETVADRSIPIRLERRRKDEPVERFLMREAAVPADPIHERVSEWAKANRVKLSKARPRMPNELNDRMVEGCEPLVAIADRLGAGPAARTALVEVLGGERLDDVETLRLRLLRDLKAIFAKHPKSRSAFTNSLLTELHRIEDAPWESYYGRGFESRDLGSLLRHYGIRSTTVRAKDKVARGYRRDDLQAAWNRYL